MWEESGKAAVLEAMSMTRRTLFGFIPLPLLAALQPKKHKWWPRQEPNMAQLIMGALHGFTKEQREYDSRVLERALKITGPLIGSPTEAETGVYGADSVFYRRRAGSHFWFEKLPDAYGTLVPDEILPMIPPENRGEMFPRGVPFEPLT